MTRRPEPADALDVTATRGLGVTIDREGEVPIGLQLVWALRARIGEQQFQPGARLPGLRELAQETGVNVNTARAVYQRLEQEGLIETQHGSGTFVAAGSRRSSQVSAIAAGAARKARQAGVDPREVAAALYITSQPLAATDRAAASRRAVLRTQISALEAALAELASAHPGLAQPTGATAAGDGPKLPTSEELEQIRAQLVRRLSTLQSAIDALAEEEPADTGRRRAARKRPARSRVSKPAANPAPASG